MRRALVRRDIFVDSSAFFAILNRSDHHFEDAQRILARAANERRRLITSNFIIAETHALLLTRMNPLTATRFLQETEVSSMVIARAQERDEASARSIIYSYRDKTFSLTDAISFAIMERLEIRLAFTFDRDYSQYGFEAIRS